MFTIKYKRQNGYETDVSPPRVKWATPDSITFDVSLSNDGRKGTVVVTRENLAEMTQKMDRSLANFLTGKYPNG
jgi:hypothetical protein